MIGPFFFKGIAAAGLDKLTTSFHLNTSWRQTALLHLCLIQQLKPAFSSVCIAEFLKVESQFSELAHGGGVDCFRSS